jgi:heme-degrading monooxygenase HmoA
MAEIMARVEVGDFDAWLKTHLENSDNRRSFGMIDGPIYRDIDNSNAVFVHTHVEDLDRAMQWFETDAFKEATKRSTAIRRDFFLAEKQGPPAR